MRNSDLPAGLAGAASLGLLVFLAHLPFWLGLIAAGLGTAASWAVTRFVLQSPWSFLPGTLAATVLGCVVLMLGFGYVGTEAALRVRPAGLLRNQ